MKRKKYIKRIGALALCAVLSIGVIGCGKTETVEPEVAAEPVEVKIPDGAGTFQGHSYYVEQLENATWEEAEAHFEALGGHLLVIENQEENDYAFQFMNDSGYRSAYFGLSDAEKEGTWKWVTGEEATYTNWADGEPNVDSYTENYVMFYEAFSDGKWNDCGPDSVAHTDVYIGEWDEIAETDMADTTEVETEQTTEQVADTITLTSDEIESLSVLAKYMAASNFLNVEGQEYSFDMTNADNILGFAHKMLDDYLMFDIAEISDYLPTMEYEEDEDVGNSIMTASEEYMQTYLSSIFASDFSIADCNYYHSDGVVKLYQDYSDLKETMSITINPETSITDGNYIVTGQVAYNGPYSSKLIRTDDFILTVTKDSASPFGFKVIGMAFTNSDGASNHASSGTSPELGGNYQLTDAQCEAVLQMVEVATDEKVSHWHMNEDFEISYEDLSAGHQMMYLDNHTSYFITENRAYHDGNMYSVYDGKENLRESIIGAKVDENGRLIVAGINMYDVPFWVYLQKDVEDYCFDHIYYFVSQSPLGNTGVH